MKENKLLSKLNYGEEFLENEVRRKGSVQMVHELPSVCVDAKITSRIQFESESNIEVEALNWLYNMGLSSSDVTADIPFKFDQAYLSTKKLPQILIPATTKSVELKHPPSIKIDQKQGDIENSSRQIADSCKNLDELRSAVTEFNGCLLKKTAINTVFADGCHEAKIMLIGEAPGASEDATGIPFCGESGKLLDNIFKSIALSRAQNLYITNSVFWRPPANRRPTIEEIEICKPFLEKHIALINPDLIVLVGSTAVSAIIGHHSKISDVRGKFLNYTNKYLTKSINLTAIFHPAYLLRQPSQKKDTWYDMLKIFRYLSLQ